MTETHWTLGVLIGLPIWGLVFLGLIAWICFTIYGLRHEDDKYADAFEWKMGIGLGVGTFVLLAGLALSPLGFYPYKAEYHQWRPVSGVVQQANVRLIADGKGMSQRYVLVINNQPYGVDDTRAALVKAGDTVSLSCKRDWQYASVPGYVCRWNQ